MPGTFSALLILCVSVFWIADTSTFTCKELNHGILSTSHYSVAHNRDGYHILIYSTKGNERIVEDFLCDSTFATLRWHYQSGPNTDIFFRRNANSIGLLGILRGKPIQKNLTIDSYPWYQIVPLGLQTVSQDSAGRSKFWAVSLEEPAMLKAIRFYIAGIANAALPGHVEIACRRFRLKIGGLPAQFWTGDYFIREDNNTFVYYEGHSFNSKKPTGTIEVVEQ